MSDVQKIVVLCILVVGIIAAILVVRRDSTLPNVSDLINKEPEPAEQIDPPSLELDAGPADTNVERGTETTDIGREVR